MDLDNMGALWQYWLDFPSFDGSVDNTLEEACMVIQNDEVLRVMPVTMNVIDAVFKGIGETEVILENMVSVGSGVWKEFHWIIKWFWNQCACWQWIMMWSRLDIYMYI